MSNIPTFVLDASVGAKWFYKESLSENASHFLERLMRREIRIVVPEFFYSEIAHVFVKRLRRKMITFEQALLELDEAMELPIEFYPDRELADVALENALRFKISVYDSLYLSLAEIYVAPLITADEALLKACQKKFDFIESLQDFSWKPGRKS